MKFSKYVLTMCVLSVLAMPGMAQIGIFDASQDITDGSNLGADGSAEFDDATGTYSVTGSGNDIWGTADNFHFLYTEVSGDFVLEADVVANAGTSTDEWVKAMLMARDELVASSVNYGMLIRTDGLLNSQWRTTAGADSASLDSALRVTIPELTARLRIERSGDHFSSSYIDPATGNWVLYQEMDIVMADPIYVGLAVTAHQVGSLATGVFSDVELSAGSSSTENWEVIK
jgi:regulation of enolase protein 1 (concanavalin A-like superfamily)